MADTDPRNLPELAAELHDDLSQLSHALAPLDPSAPGQLQPLISTVAKTAGWLLAHGAHDQTPARGEAKLTAPGAERNIRDLAADARDDLAKLILGLHHDVGVPAEDLTHLVDSAGGLRDLVEYIDGDPSLAAHAIVDSPSGDPADSNSLGAGIASMVQRSQTGPNHAAAFDAIDQEAARQRDLQTSASAAINQARAGAAPKRYTAGSRSKPYQPKPVYRGGGRKELDKIRGGH